MSEMPKYMQIVNWIKEKLETKELTAGSKIHSENELVSLFGVSRQTVRHAISVLENEGIVERLRGSGTYIKGPKPVEAQKHSNMRIAIMTTYVDEYIFPSMLKEMERLFSKSGYAIQIAFTHNTVEKERMILKGFLRSGAIDGIVAETTKSGLPNPNLDLYRQLKKRGIPIVFLNSYYRDLEAIHVSMDDVMAGRLVTEHLIQCGHRKIGGIFKSDDGQGHSRYKGYIDALMEEDIKVKGERISWMDTVDLHRMNQDMSRYLSRLMDCTACVCYNDEVANKLVGICKEAGILVPEQLSIVGIDNSDLAGYCEVPLTSANNPIIELAEAAAGTLLNMLAGSQNIESTELEPTLVIRNSVKMIDSMQPINEKEYRISERRRKDE